MSKLIGGGRDSGGVILDDRWRFVDSEAQFRTLRPGQAAYMPLAVWRTVRAELLVTGRPLGVLLGATDEPRELADDVGKLALIAIHIEKFSDGRGYSLARIVREQLAYRGELRATGDVLRDQIFNLSRCGFDSFALREDQDVEDAFKAFYDFRESYQASVERPTPLYRRRLSALAALAGDEAP